MERIYKMTDKDYYHNEIKEVLETMNENDYPSLQIYGTMKRTKHLALTSEGIDEVIKALKTLKKSKAHKTRESKRKE